MRSIVQLQNLMTNLVTTIHFYWRQLTLKSFPASSITLVHLYLINDLVVVPTVPLRASSVPGTQMARKNQQRVPFTPTVVHHSRRAFKNLHAISCQLDLSCCWLGKCIRPPCCWGACMHGWMHNNVQMVMAQQALPKTWLRAAEEYQDKHPQHPTGTRKHPAYVCVRVATATEHAAVSAFLSLPSGPKSL